MELETIFYLSIGSNLGDRTSYLEKGIRTLEKHSCRITRLSSVYETSAVGLIDAPDFLNICVEGSTTLEPSVLMKTLLEIEQTFGRQRSGLGLSSRTLDMDLILFGNTVVNSSELTVPHPRYLTRRFVLEPLLEINPNLVDPAEMKPVFDFFVELTDFSEVKKLEISLFT